MNDSEKTFIVTDSCMWEANRIAGTRAPHVIEVVDIDSGQVRYISSGSKIKFLEGDITEQHTQEAYNEQQKICEEEHDSKESIA